MARVLVVDDDDQICAIVRRLLQTDGHDVSIVTKAAQAASKLESHQFDILIVDLVMPKQGGIDLIMEIRAQHNDIPIIVMSGQIPVGGESVSRLVARYGASVALAKPFTGAELREAVTSALAE